MKVFQTNILKYRKTLTRVILCSVAMGSFCVSSSWGMKEEDLPKSSVVSKNIDNNSPEDCFKKGLLYFQGKDVEQDYTEAMKWWRLAANQNCSISQYNIGTLYLHGQGVKQNYEEAMKWYLLAAQQNHSRAQFSIGTLYWGGLGGVEKNYEEALYWFLLAANQNYAPAQHRIGFFYESGSLGFEKDDEEALKWYLKAAKYSNNDTLRTEINNKINNLYIKLQNHVREFFEN